MSLINYIIVVHLLIRHTFCLKKGIHGTKTKVLLNIGARSLVCKMALGNEAYFPQNEHSRPIHAIWIWFL